MARSLVVGAGGFPEVLVDEAETASGSVFFAPLPSVAIAVEEVARALRAARVEATAPLLDPDLKELTDAWASAQKIGGPLVVHFSGHGAPSGEGGLYLALRNSRPDKLRRTCAEVSGLLKDAQEARQPVLFLLDVCGAGAAVHEQLARELFQASRYGRTGRNAWVIGACAAGETTRQARFSRATAVVLRRLADGWLDVSPVLPHVPVGTLAAEIARELARDGGLGQSVVYTPDEFALAEVPAFFPNPTYAPDAPGRFLSGLTTALRRLALDTDPALDLLHFATRAAGNKHADVCQFSGRAAELARIKAWLDDAAGDQDRLFAVIGSPGSGKSALLGIVTCLLHPALEPQRRLVRSRVAPFDLDARGRFLAVHARQLTLQQIIESLMRQLREPAPRQGAETPSDRQRRPAAAVSLDDLTGLLEAAGPTVVVLDALDEAADPAEVVRELILPLVGAGPGRHQGVSHCRVMVGTRPWWETLPELREYTARRPTARLELDPVTADESRRLAEDLTQYLDLLLDQRYPAGTARQIAEHLVEGTTTGMFLIAALYAEHLLDQAATGQLPDEQAVRDALPRTITDVFELHIRSLATADPWNLTVLRALGRSRGQGMPLGLLHEVALATAGDEEQAGGLRPSLEDTRRSLRAVAFYLHTTPDSEQRQLYRYFHQALTNHTTRDTDPVAVHEALLRTVPRTPDGALDWESSHPYVKRHAAAHAAEAGSVYLDGLLEDPLFLLHADPDGLAPYLDRAVGPTAALHARIYRAHTAHHRERTQPAVRRDLLALDAAAWRAPDLARALATAPLGQQVAPAIPLWATNNTGHQARRGLDGHTGAVRAVATAVLPDGRALAITADLRGQALVWDLTTGEKLHSLSGHTGWVDAVATAVLPDGQALALTAGARGAVLVWDLTAGQQVRAFTGHTAGVLTAASAVLPDGRALAVTADEAARVLVWDLTTGEPLRELHPPTQVRAVATVVLPDGPALAVTAGDGGQARAWDLATGESLPPVLGHLTTVRTVAAAVLPDDRAVAVTADLAGSVMAWDPTTGELLRVLPEHPEGGAFSVAVAVPPDGQALAVSTGDHGRVQSAYLAEGGRPHRMPGHGGLVHGVATAVLPDGRCLAITAAAGGEVFVWDLAAREDDSAQQAAGPARLAAAVLPDGRTLAVLAGEEQVQVWDTRTGRHVSTFADHFAGVQAVACAVLPNGRAYTVTADHAKVQVWNTITGRCCYTVPEHPGGAHAVATAVLPSGQALAITADHSGVLVRDLPTGELLYSHSEWFERSVMAVAAAVQPDGRTFVLIGCSDGEVLAWEPAAGTFPYRLTRHGGSVDWLATAVLPGGRALAAVGSVGGLVTVWDLSTGEGLYEILCSSRMHGVGLATLPGGRVVAVTVEGDGSVPVWDFHAGKQLCLTLARMPGGVRSVATTAEGFLVADGREAAYLRWNLPDVP